MTLTRKDAVATALTALVVLTFVATHESWNVWLIGSSHRSAAVVITLLGALTCGLGSAGKERSKGASMDTATRLLSAAGVAAMLFAIWAIWTASLTPLSLLVVSIVVLWAGATLRHAWHPTQGPITT